MTTDHARTRGRAVRIFAATVKWGGLGVAALLALGATYQGVSSALDRGRYPAPGTLVAVNGSRMHIHCTGSGQPTVILEAGNGGFSPTWAWIQPHLATHTRVCSYDRGGLGWSDPGGASRDAATVAHELMALLMAAGETGQFLLVGHSLGGIYGLVFAAEFPAKVVGLGLLDASHPQQFERFPEEIRRQMASYQRLMGLAPIAASFGLIRITNFYGRMARGLPEADYARAAAMGSRARHIRTSNAEIAEWSVNAQRLAAAADLRELPLVVITAGAGAGLPAEVMESHHVNQRELAGLSSRSSHVVLEEADHLSVLMREEHAGIVAETLRTLIDTVRCDMRQRDQPQTGSGQ